MIKQKFLKLLSKAEVALRLVAQKLAPAPFHEGSRTLDGERAGTVGLKPCSHKLKFRGALCNGVVTAVPLLTIRVVALTHLVAIVDSASALRQAEAP